MSAPRILVTGATGRTGGAIARLLLDRGAEVRALVHRDDARAERLRAAGAEVVVGDLFDPLQVRAALRDVARVSFTRPWHPFMSYAAVVLATEVRHAEVEHVVGLSQWLASPEHPSLATRQNWLVDRLFADLPGITHTTVNPGFFADNYLGNGLTGFAAQLGVLPLPIGDSRNAPPSNEDIAAVAAAALLDPGRHAGRTYRPTGPELLSGADMAAILTRVLGRRVRHVDMPLWMFLRALRVMGPRVGIGTAEIAEFRWYFPEHKLGTFETGAPTAHVHDTTGRPPESFATIAARYAEHPTARRTPKNLCVALLDFMRIGVTPTPRLDRFVTKSGQPVPAEARYAGEADVWQLEHRPPTSLNVRLGT